MATARRALALPCLALLLLQRAPGAGAREDRGFQLLQPQDKERVTAGQTLTLTCTVSEFGPIGAVRWLKGWGSGNKTIYDQRGSFPRVTRVVRDSNMDFSIRIRDVQPEDAGTYYCVKFRKVLYGNEVFRRGSGTVVSVRGAGARVDQGFQLLQPQDKVWVTAGQTLNLTCAMSGLSLPGPVRWLKGWGSGNKTIYDQTGSFPRVTRVVNKSNTDFSILIRDVQPEDAGTYYCVKFQKADEGDELFQRGSGTVVSVSAKPTNLVVSGPGRRVGTGQAVSVTCTAGGFFPEDITVRWLKDGSQVSSQQPRVTPEQTKSSYTMSSTVTVMLEDKDIHSQLICEVQHPTLTAPLRGTYALREALRVSPRVHVDVEPPRPVEVSKTVNFTCHAKGFYPGDAAVTWLENGMEMKTESVSRPKENVEGLFDLSSPLAVRATEEKNGSAFTCQVVHDAQDPVNGTATLWIAALPGQGPSDHSPTGAILLSSLGLWLGILLEKGLLFGLLVFLFKRERA